jgi:hypothetical protein
MHMICFLEVVQQNMKKYHVHCGSLCEITAPIDKMCGNESKIRRKSQNYRFFSNPVFLFFNFQMNLKADKKPN